MRRPALQPSRRAVLGGALAALVAPAVSACTSDADDSEEPRRERDVVAADRAAELERRLLAAYDSALVLAPQLADRLQPLRDDHAAHLAALALPEQGAEPAPTEGAATEPTPEPTAPSVPAPPLPPEPAALLAALAELERRAATTHGSAAVLSGRGIGAVLASLSASEASHVVALQ